MNICFLEDDDAQAELVTRWLENKGHHVFRSADCESFLAQFESQFVDALLLDWELPDGTGIDVLRNIRVRHRTPAIFITQRDTEEDIVHALRNGADDYLVKPIREGELNARLEALLRRTAPQAAKLQTLSYGIYCFDLGREQITMKGQPLDLTQKDFALALCLFEHFGQALSRDYLLKTVWDINASVNTRTVDMHVSRLRRALKLNPENGFIVKTIYQYGYRLEKLVE